MSRLDRLETFWKSEAVLGEDPSLIADVLALVNVAKAAEKIPPEIMAMLPKLREALGVLDKEPA